MKLRNKNTRKIIDLDYWNMLTFRDEIVLESDNGEEYCYHSLTELNGEWEDVEDINVTTMPLIKDEKIRKLVRLCANIWETEKLLVTKLGSIIDFSDGYMRHVDFSYAEWQDEIEDRTYYTIEELCGEEEE